MLTQLTIQHFAIVQFLELEFQQGMTTITGETGAGKSIAIDALGLCLGERADANMVRLGTDKAEVRQSPHEHRHHLQSAGRHLNYGDQLPHPTSEKRHRHPSLPPDSVKSFHHRFVQDYRVP